MTGLTRFALVPFCQYFSSKKLALRHAFPCLECVNAQFSNRRAIPCAGRAGGASSKGGWTRWPRHLPAGSVTIPEYGDKQVGSRQSGSDCARNVQALGRRAARTGSGSSPPLVTAMESLARICLGSGRQTRQGRDPAGGADLGRPAGLQHPLGRPAADRRRRGRRAAGIQCGQVWRVVDEFATRTHTSYLTERVRMAQEESSIQPRIHCPALQPELRPTAETVSQVAAALGMDSTARFGLVAASGDAARPPNGRDQPGLRATAAQPDLRPRIRREHLRVLAAPAILGRSAKRGARCTRRVGRHPMRLCPGASPGCAACPPPPGPQRASPPCCGLRDSGPLSAEAAWARLAKQQMLRTPAWTCWPTWRRPVRSAAAGNGNVWKKRCSIIFDTGNITATAEQLFCHRNTILNRLNRFQELTGIDLTVPAQAARLVVAWA